MFLTSVRPHFPSSSSSIFSYFQKFTSASVAFFVVVLIWLPVQTTLLDSHKILEVNVVPCQSSGRSLWRPHHFYFFPSADVCRWSQTLTLCSVQTGWSTSLHPPSTPHCAPRRPQTLWHSEPAAAGSSPAACHG